MKKIVSLLLALISVFVFVSCGEEKTTPAEEFIKVVNSSVPTKITTQTTYSVSKSEITFRGRYETILYGSDFEMSYKYEDFADPSTATDPEAYMQTHEGTVYYHDGLYSTDGENWAASAPSVTTMQVKLELDPKNLGEFTISRDGKTLTTVISAEDAKEILGITIGVTEDGVKLTIGHDGQNLRSIKVSYSTENASVVSLDTSYSYESENSPFDDVPETTPTEG